MLQRTLSLSALVLMSIIAFSGQAQAETQEVPFSGTITPKCTFSNLQAGLLENDSQDPYALYDLTQPGGVNIACNTPATLSVADPVDNGSTGATSFDDFTGALIINNVEDISSSPGGVSLWGSTDPLNIPGDSIPQSIYVGMRVGTTDAAIQSGDYKFLVTLTSTP